MRVTIRTILDEKLLVELDWLTPQHIMFILKDEGFDLSDNKMITCYHLIQTNDLVYEQHQERKYPVI